MSILQSDEEAPMTAILAIQRIVSQKGFSDDCNAIEALTKELLVLNDIGKTNPKTALINPSNILRLFCHLNVRMRKAETQSLRVKLNGALIAIRDFASNCYAKFFNSGDVVNVCATVNDLIEKYPNLDGVHEACIIFVNVLVVRLVVLDSYKSTFDALGERILVIFETHAKKPFKDLTSAQRSIIIQLSSMFEKLVYIKPTDKMVNQPEYYFHWCSCIVNAFSNNADIYSDNPEANTITRNCLRSMFEIFNWPQYLPAEKREECRFDINFKAMKFLISNLDNPRAHSALETALHIFTSVDPSVEECIRGQSYAIKHVFVLFKCMVHMNLFIASGEYPERYHDFVFFRRSARSRFEKILDVHEEVRRPVLNTLVRIITVNLQSFDNDANTEIAKSQTSTALDSIGCYAEIFKTNDSLCDNVLAPFLERNIVRLLYVLDGQRKYAAFSLCHSLVDVFATKKSLSRFTNFFVKCALTCSDHDKRVFFCTFVCYLSKFSHYFEKVLECMDVIMRTAIFIMSNSAEHADISFFEALDELSRANGFHLKIRPYLPAFMAALREYDHYYSEEADEDEVASPDELICRTLSTDVVLNTAWKFIHHKNEFDFKDVYQPFVEYASALITDDDSSDLGRVMPVALRCVLGLASADPGVFGRSGIMENYLSCVVIDKDNITVYLDLVRLYTTIEKNPEKIERVKQKFLSIMIKGLKKGKSSHYCALAWLIETGIGVSRVINRCLVHIADIFQQNTMRGFFGMFFFSIINSFLLWRS